jgi:hypothetical protein
MYRGAVTDDRVSTLSRHRRPPAIARDAVAPRTLARLVRA